MFGTNKSTGHYNFMFDDHCFIFCHFKQPYLIPKVKAEVNLSSDLPFHFLQIWETWEGYFYNHYFPGYKSYTTGHSSNV